MTIHNRDVIRAALSTAALLLALLCTQPAAFAHARLLRSQPAADAALKQAPKTVELWFSEELDAGGSAIEVTDQTGKRVDKQNVGLAEGDKKLQVELEDLASGTFTVDWKALSTVGCEIGMILPLESREPPASEVTIGLWVESSRMICASLPTIT